MDKFKVGDYVVIRHVNKDLDGKWGIIDKIDHNNWTKKGLILQQYRIKAVNKDNSIIDNYYDWYPEEQLKLYHVKDNGIARRLYKDRILKIENGLIYLKG